MTLNSENLFIDAFIESYKSHLKKFNKILTKNHSVYDQLRKLKTLLSNIKVDIKQYKKGFNSNQKEKCNSQFNDLVELNSKIKERCKLLEKEIAKIEFEEYDPYPYSNEYKHPDEIKAEVEDFISSVKANSLKEEKKIKELKLHEFIYNIKNKDKFLIDLKTTFKTERGVEIRALIESLIASKIIIIGNRQFKNFTELLGNYLDRNIGTYQSINDANEYSHSSLAINEKLEPIILKYKQLN